MASSNLSKTRALKIIQAILLIVVGILIACSIISQDFIKYIVGIALVVLGAFDLFRSVYDTKSFIMPIGVIGGVLLGIGIAVMCDYVQLIQVLQNIIFVSLIVLGSLLLIDSIVKLALKRTNTGITELIIGAILLVIGILFVCIPEMTEYCWVAFGVVLVLYGLYSLVISIIAISKK